MKDEATLVVIVPGSKPKTVPLARPLIRRCYAFLGVDESDNGETWALDLQAYLHEHGDVDTTIFSWTGGIGPASIARAARRLAAFIAAHAGYRSIVLFGKSVGGLVAERALLGGGEFPNVTRLIYVAAPHPSRRVRLPARIRLVNIYSPQDRMLRLANTVICRGRGTLVIEGAEDVRLDRVTHSGFNRNTTVEHDGRPLPLFELYRRCIERRTWRREGGVPT